MSRPLTFKRLFSLEFQLASARYLARYIEQIRDERSQLDFVLARLDSSQPLPEGCNLGYLYSRLKFLEDILMNKDDRPSTQVIVPLEENVSLIRQLIAIISRPSLRPLHITDLPNEILVKIFEHVEDWQMSETSFSPLAEGAHDIQNARLVCRRFHDLCSQLLVRSVTVGFTEKSLSHLKEVASHPFISKGIRCVLVSLDYYDPQFSQSISLFVDYHLSLLEGWYYPTSQEDPRRATIDIFEKIATDMSKKQRALQYGGLKLDDFVDDDPKVAAIRAMLFRTHEQYQKLCDTQGHLLLSGKFIADIMVALVKMPHVHMLHILDRVVKDMMHNMDSRRFPEFDLVNDLDALSKVILLPHTWDFSRAHSTYTAPPIDLLVQIPAALGKADVNVTDLTIVVPVPDSLQWMVPTAQQSQEINALAQKLSRFRFGHHPHFNPDEEPLLIHGIIPMNDYVRFFAPFLNTPTIQWLDIRCEYLDGFFSLIQREKKFCSGPLFRLRQWSNPRYLALRGFEIHASELKRLMRTRGPEHTTLLEDLTLLSGEWSDVLDHMRPEEGSFHDISIRIQEDSELGGTRDDVMRRVLLFHHVCRLSNRLSPAEQYVCGLTKVNPFIPRPIPTQADTEILNSFLEFRTRQRKSIGIHAIPIGDGWT